MENKWAELYNELAGEIISMIPTDFEEVYCMCEVPGDGSKTVMFYFKDCETKEFVRSFNIPEVYHVSKQIWDTSQHKLYTIVEEIYGVFSENEQELWTLLDMYFNSEGKFRVNFSYDSIDHEKYPHIARCAIWTYKKMGILPQKESFSYKYVEKYIKENEDTPL